MAKDIIKKKLLELSEALDKKELTSVEIMQAYLNRIKKVDGELHTFLAMNNNALNDAKKADERIAKGNRLSKLDGIPVAIKDVILTEGIETTASSNMLKGFVPLEDATVVSKLKEAGSIIIGKNNCDAWAHGSSTENSDFGPSKNPWNTKHVPGGSSGGSTACVAANEAPLSIGTDTGGSIRQPAGFCGVVGLKPTYGLCSRYGLIAMASSLDCPGPITNSVYDNAVSLGIMVGSDEKDATSAGACVKDYLKDIEKGVQGLKVGIPKEYFEKGIQKEVKDSVLKASNKLSVQGAEIVDVGLPNTEYGIATYYVTQSAEVSSNLGRYDGIKYGYTSKKSDNLIDLYYKSRSEGFGNEAKRRIMLGTYVLSAGYYDAYYEQAMKVRTIIKNDFENAFSKCDVILAPTTPTVAFKFGDHTNDPLEMYLQDAYTVNMNLAGVPALAMPCGFDSANLPIGMQFVGPMFSENLLYRFGYAYEQATKDEEWRSKNPKI